ncbi:MAG: hypothetical protein M5U01_37915 [Ardenticatenaceae bacterium]|nr:hypothetical protein [Ardenticatenaceae bacterium]
MSSNARRITAIVAALLVGVVLVGGLAATTALAQGPVPWGGGGMMGGGGTTGPGGMMGGGGMMGPGGMMGSGGMMGGWGAPGTGTPLTPEQVAERARQYVATYGNPDLEVAEIMEFDNHFYVQAREQSTGRFAFEFLIDRTSGATHPEPGPNMMWNTRYGHMGGWGGMMGRWWNRQGGPETVTAEEALAQAQQWLDANLPGTTVGDEADAFYGYYTIHTLKDGQIAGMLSVNGYTGQVWYHSWHGTFIGMAHEEE